MYIYTFSLALLILCTFFLVLFPLQHFTPSVFNPFASETPSQPAEQIEVEPSPAPLPFNPFADALRSPSPKPMQASLSLSAASAPPPALAWPESQPDVSSISLPPINMSIGLPPITVPIPTSAPAPQLRHIEEPAPVNASAMADLFGGQRSFTQGPNLSFQFQAVAPQAPGTAYEPAVAKISKRDIPNPFAANPVGKGGVAAGVTKKSGAKGGSTKRAPPTREGYLEHSISGRGKYVVYPIFYIYFFIFCWLYIFC